MRPAIPVPQSARPAADGRGSLPGLPRAECEHHHEDAGTPDIERHDVATLPPMKRSCWAAPLALTLAVGVCVTGCGAEPLGPASTVTVTATVTASPSVVDLESAKDELLPLLAKMDKAVLRLNDDQNSSSMAVKRRAAKSLAEAQDKLVRTLSKQDWPAQIEKEVASLVKQLNRSYPIAQTMSVTKDAEDFYNLAVDLYKEGGDLAAAARALEVKLGS